MKITSMDRLLMKCAWGCADKTLFFSKIAHLTPKGVQGKIPEFKPTEMTVQISKREPPNLENDNKPNAFGMQKIIYLWC